MSVVAFQVHVVVPRCPCGSSCCQESPLSGLAERLRNEMRYGRHHYRGPTNLPGVTIGMMAAFCNCPERN